MARKFIPIQTILKNKISLSLNPRPKFQFFKDTAEQQLPNTFDLKNEIKEIYDQGSLNSCVANAVCLCYKMLQKNKAFNPSRLFIYYKSREREPEPNGIITDSGSYVENALRYIETKGICSEEYWPYDQIKVNEKPPSALDTKAIEHRLSGIFDIMEMKAEKQINKIRASIFGGLPILCALAVYRSFDSKETRDEGKVSIPTPNNYFDKDDSKDQFLGGHQLLIIGYDHPKRLFICANSYGDKHGDKGYLWVPYDYITNHHHVFDLCAFLTIVEE